MLSNGLVINQELFQIRLKGFIADRPARSFLRCTKGHTGYCSCERCCVKGKMFMRRVIFNDVNCKKRTDESFRNKEDPQHHLPNQDSPLLKIAGVDMVNHFILDSMHLVCLGVLKKLLDLWCKGKNNLSKETLLTLSQRLINLSEQIPSDFQRTTRSLGDLSKWKATEFRFFFVIWWSFCY